MLLSDSLKQLLNILADGEFHSGTELAQQVAISRSAIWKQLQALEDLGVDLIAVTGKGYRLQQPLQLLNQQAVISQLAPLTQTLVNQLQIHDVIDSTNRHLLEQARQGAASGTVCVAEHQTAGRGRRGRQWVSPFGHNLYLSILWHYQNGPASIAGLSLALGVAVVRALKQLGVEEVGLKWPNDIYCQQRKLAGILVEVSGESSGPCHAVIGLGLNFYLSPQQAETIEQAWIDIASVLGENAHQHRNHLLALLLNQLMPVIAEFESKGLSHFVDEWRSYDCLKGQAASLYIGENRFDGTIVGIDDNGLIQLADTQGQIRTYASGEVSFRAS